MAFLSAFLIRIWIEVVAELLYTKETPFAKLIIIGIILAKLIYGSWRFLYQTKKKDITELFAIDI